MRNAGFIVAVSSFLVRKGLIALLNQIEGVRVIREFEEVDPVDRFIRVHGTGFMIISRELYEKASQLFLSHPGLLERTLLLMEPSSGVDNFKGHATISLKDGREEITGKIRQLMETHPTGSEGVENAKLTPREVTIVRLVSMGLTNRQIADRLFLSTHTVTTHRKNINNKLGLRTVSGLIVYAIVNNIITLEEVSTKPA